MAATLLLFFIGMVMVTAGLDTTPLKTGLVVGGIIALAAADRRS